MAGYRTKRTVRDFSGSDEYLSAMSMLAVTMIPLSDYRLRLLMQSACKNDSQMAEELGRYMAGTGLIIDNGTNFSSENALTPPVRLITLKMMKDNDISLLKTLKKVKDVLCDPKRSYYTMVPDDYFCIVEALTDPDSADLSPLNSKEESRTVTDLVRYIVSDRNLVGEHRAFVDSLPYTLWFAVVRDVEYQVLDKSRQFDYDLLRELVSGSRGLADNEKAVIYEKLVLPTRLLRGRFDDWGFSEETAMTYTGLVAYGIRRYAEGNWARAESLMRNALRRVNGDNGCFGYTLYDLMFVASLMKSGSRMAVKSLESIRKKKAFSSSRYAAVNLLLSTFTGDPSEKDISRVTDYVPLAYLLDECVSYIVLRQIDPNTAKDDWIFREARDTIDENDDYALFRRTDLVPYVPKEKWERSYENLIVKLGYNSTQGKDPAQKAASTSRIIYLLDTDNYCIQPVLQKSKDGINWTKGRNIALSTFKTGIPEMNVQDRTLMGKVNCYNSWSGPVWSLKGEDAAAQLAGHPNVFSASNPDIRINITIEEPYVVVKHKKDGYHFDSNVKVSSLSGLDQLTKETDTLFKVVKMNLRQKDIITTLSGIIFPDTASEEAKRLLGFISRDITVHSDMLTADGGAETVETDSRITVTLQPVDEAFKVGLYVKPFVDVPPYLTPGEGNVEVISRREGKAVQTTRKLKSEKKNLAVVSDAISDYVEEDSGSAGNLLCDGAEKCLSLLDELHNMGEDVRIEWPEGCKFRIAGSAGVGGLNISVKSRTNWFEMDGALEISESRVMTMTEILAAFKDSRGRFIKIGQTEYLSLSEQLRKVLASIAGYSSQISDKSVRIPKLAVSLVDDLCRCGAEVKEDAAVKKMIKAVRESEQCEYQVPSTLKTGLRPYQTEGFRWLCRLAGWGAGACLADDMGLGKTVQTLALLLQRASVGPALVIAPASVVSNWERESVRFAPSLHTTVINYLDTESRRKAVTEASDFDLLLATYGVLVSEQESLSGREWATVVLDEAHTIKNKDTKSSAAAMSLNAGFRLILTGTPLQNHLGEIWNLFQFINPGYLGSFAHFTEEYLVPIQEKGDKERQSMLRKMVLPFMLRRTKSDVLDELPEKTEQVIYVDLSEREKALYESIRREAEFNMEEHNANLVQTLAEILRLRQAACAPALVNKSLGTTSTKSDELVSIVSELVGGGHKVLVFSQFTSFLAIIREALDSAGTKYLYLDGSTPVSKRPAIVKSFQTGDTGVFLISLKAGGLGLNLTAADYIIHTDPWWNPSAEDQASDRAYRIGQTRPVTVYRLISKGTIEEKILQMHKTKRSLADSLLEGADMSSKLTREELLALLQK